MPMEEKEKIKKIVNGSFVARLYPEGNPAIDLLKVDYTIFAQIFTLNRRFLYKGDYTAPPEENGYEKCECYLTEDGLAGFAITDHNWLISVFSNEPWRGFLQLICPYVKKATKLVCIINGQEDNHELVNSYEKTLGFLLIAKTINDTNIMREYYGDEFIENFIRSYGYPYHVFMYRSNKVGVFPKIVTFDDYFEAEKYVDEVVK